MCKKLKIQDKSLQSESESELQNSSSESENETLASPSKNEEFCTQTTSPTKLGNLYYFFITLYSSIYGVLECHSVSKPLGHIY